MEPTKLERVTVATPEGTPVVVVRDNGSLLRTVTRSEVWQKNGDWLVMVRGITGYYLAERVYADVPTPVASESLLHAHLRTAIDALKDEADMLDGWARQSKEGGWSTHQVEPQRLRADVLRRLVATLERTLGGGR